jgi:membrane protein DedA with SNARE-associated domain
VYTLLGCIPWVFMLGYVGERLGANWEKIRPYLHYADYAVVAVVVVFLVWAVWRWRRTRRATGGPGSTEYGDEA